MHVHVYFDASPLKQSPQITFHQLIFWANFRLNLMAKTFITIPQDEIVTNIILPKVICQNN